MPKGRKSAIELGNGSSVSKNARANTGDPNTTQQRKPRKRSVSNAGNNTRASNEALAEQQRVQNWKMMPAGFSGEGNYYDSRLPYVRATEFPRNVGTSDMVMGYGTRWPVSGVNLPAGSRETLRPWSMPDPRGSSPRNIPRRTGGTANPVNPPWYEWQLPPTR